MEFALVIPLIVLVLVACMEVAALARTRVLVVAAAGEGARVAATHPDPAEASEAVVHALGQELGERARVTVSRPHVVGRPAIVEVTVKENLVSPLLSNLTVRLEGRAVMRVER